MIGNKAVKPYQSIHFFIRFVFSKYSFHFWWAKKHDYDCLHVVSLALHHLE